MLPSTGNCFQGNEWMERGREESEWKVGLAPAAICVRRRWNTRSFPRGLSEHTVRRDTGVNTVLKDSKAETQGKEENSRTRTLAACMCLGGVRCSRRQKPPTEGSVHLRRGQKDRDREIRNLKSAHRREEAARIAKMTKRYGSPSLHFIV